MQNCGVHEGAWASHVCTQLRNVEADSYDLDDCARIAVTPKLLLMMFDRG